MANLPELIKAMYPYVDFLKDVILRDDGNGPYIKEWNLPEPQPDIKDWDALATQYSKELSNTIARDKRASEYPTLQDQLDSLWHAINNGTPLEQSDFYLKNKAVKDANPLQDK